MIIQYRDARVMTSGNPAAMSIALRYMVDAYEDEPLICLRGRDLLALPAMDDYAQLVIASPADSKVLQAVDSDIRTLQKWQAEHTGYLKYPDR